MLGAELVGRAMLFIKKAWRGRVGALKLFDVDHSAQALAQRPLLSRVTDCVHPLEWGVDP